MCALYHKWLKKAIENEVWGPLFMVEDRIVLWYNCTQEKFENKEKDMNKYVGMLAGVGVLFAGAVNAGDADKAKAAAEISKQLSNPLAKIINMPLQQNWDYGAGPNDDGQHYYLQIQPVIPVELGTDWTMLSRTIFKLENEHNMGYDSATGLGDVSQTFFFAPNGNFHGWLGGVGPVFLIPLASQPELGSKKWGAGPSAIVLRQTEHWTYGLLASHTWSFAGNENRPDINSTFLQPFIARQLPGAWSVTAASEYSYDWNTDEEIFPVNLMVAKVVHIGKMPVSFSVGGRYYLDKPSGGPDWGLRGMVTLVLPNIF